MEKIATLFGKTFYKTDIDQLLKIEDLSETELIISFEANVEKHLAEKLHALGMASLSVFGGSKDVYERVDGYFREIDCDNMPAERWSSDFKVAIEGYILDKDSPDSAIVIAPHPELTEIEAYLGQLSKKSYKDIEANSVWTDKSAPSVFPE